MWEYLAILILGFWLGMALFLYVSCYWVEEILDLPAVRDGVRVEGERASASGAHARLKRLVQRVIEEAMALPALAHYAHHQPAAAARPEAAHLAADAFEARTYEDLLATAILNKVIERYQAESTGGRSGGASSGIHSASASPTPSAASTTPPHSPHTPPPLHDDDEDGSDSEWEHRAGEEAPELPRRVPFPEFGGDIIHSTENLDDLNDQNLEEMSGSDLQAVDGTWEENWLFQKKKVKTLQSVPVPMLVPNSNAEYRAMIGDRDADDTTDLSDAGTDTEDEPEYKSDIGRALQSKTVIGGKTPIDQLIDIEASNETITNNTDTTSVAKEIVNGNVEYDSNESQNTSQKESDSSTEIQEVTADFNSSNSESVIVVGVDSGPLSKAEFAVGEIHRTNSSPVGEDDVDGVVSAINTIVLNKENTNTLSNHQREGEYEETTAKPVQRYADSLRKQHYSPDNLVEANENDNDPASADNHEEDLIPGSIAERERKKWLNYVEMPNNPYSAEAIQKRLSAKSTSAVFDFLTTKTSDGDKTTNETDVKKETFDKNSPSPSPKILKDVLAEEVPQYKRYGRDYYINEAKRSAGARKMNNNNMSATSSLSSINKATSLEHFDTNEFTSPGLLIKQFNSPAVVQENEAKKVNAKPKEDSITTTNSINNEKNLVSIEYENAEQSLFSAKPAYVEDNTDEKFEDILRSVAQVKQQELLKSENNFGSSSMAGSNGIDESLLSSSSLEDSIKIYNVPTGEIVKNPRDIQQATRRDDSLTDLDKNDNSVTSDKNTETGEEEKPISNENDTVKLDASRDHTIMNGSGIKNDAEDLQVILPKVKDLAKKFVKFENNELRPPKSTPRARKFSNDYELEVVNKSDQKLTGKQIGYMHSLTARSISKEFREELRLSMATPIKVPGGSNELPEGIEDVTREASSPGSPVPEPGTLKNKLAFFESLRY